jgi:hypothetical protein
MLLIFVSLFVHISFSFLFLFVWIDLRTMARRMKRGGAQQRARPKPRRQGRQGGGGGGPRWVAPSAGGFETGAVAPGAFASNVIARDPVVKPIPGGVRVTHMERALSVNCAADKVKYERIEVSPRNLPWIKGFSHHFQNFRVVKFHVHSAPVASTSSGTRIVMSPYYSSSVPYVAVPGANDKALVDFGTLPGAKQFAGWAEAKVAWLASRAVRQTFKLFNIRAAPQALTEIQATEDETPGYVIIELNSPGTAQHVADMWVEYTFDLIDPMVQPNGAAIYSASTTSSNLALEACAKASGFLGNYRFYGNTITFNCSGFYTLIIAQEGTDPLPDYDGHTVADGVGNDVTTARLISAWDVSSVTLDTVMDSADFALQAESSTRAIQVLFLDVRGGDVLTIDALTSGTLTSTTIHLLPTAPGIPLRK